MGGISEVNKVPAARQRRRTHRANATDGAIRKLKDALSGSLAKAVNMSSRGANTERKKTSKDLGEIGKLSWGEESRLGAEQKIGELKDRIAISGKYTQKQLKGEKKKKELGAQEKAARVGIAY